MKTTYRILIVIALVTISWWFQALLEEKPDIFIPGKERFADFFLDNFKATVYDSNGKAQHVIHAERLDHYVDEEIAEVQHVRVEFRGIQSDWSIHADRGIINTAQNKIEFIENVIVNRPASDNSNAMTMTTSYMELDTKREVISTDKPVKVETAQSSLLAQGMTYDNKKGVLNLTNKVKGTYVTH